MKKYFVRSLLCHLSLLLVCTSSLAQKAGSDMFDDSLIADSTSNAVVNNIVSARNDTASKSFTFTLSNDSLYAWRSGKDFRYIQYLDSLLKDTKGLTIDTTSEGNVHGINKKKRGDARDIENGNTVFNSPFVKFFFWALALGFIAFILYRFFFTESIFKRSPRTNDISPPQVEIVVTSSTYDILIYDAVINKDFRLAVRYLYLQTLQKLAESGLLQLSPDKTNEEYVKELSGNVHQKEFASITLNYEYVWYGKFDINLDTFRRLQKDFKQYYQRL